MQLGKCWQVPCYQLLPLATQQQLHTTFSSASCRFVNGHSRSTLPGSSGSSSSCA